MTNSKIKWFSQGGGVESEPDDIRTLRILCDIGNTIDPSIQLEFDAPSMHQDGKLPILDIKVWVEEGRIRHSFYRKEVASNRVIMERSAVSTRVKRDTLFQEGLRRLRNMDRGSTEEEEKEVLGEFSNSMMVSGYSEKVRRDIVKGVLERGKQVESEIEAGNRVRFRTREEIDEMKSKNKHRHRSTWYLRGGATGVLCVPATPGSQLCKRIREGIKEMWCPDGGLTKVVELGGGLHHGRVK